MTIIFNEATHVLSSPLSRFPARRSDLLHLLPASFVNRYCYGGFFLLRSVLAEATFELIVLSPILKVKLFD